MTAQQALDQHFRVEAERLREMFPELSDDEVHRLIVEGLTR